jgi:hypothetical protein
MKQTTNIILLTIVLSIPFALSQTRKAIPAGRYEALSGVKISHSGKTGESSLTKDSLGLFLSEVAKHIPQGRSENFFYSSGEIETSFKSFLVTKGVSEGKNFDSTVNVLLSDNLVRDIDLFKKIKKKGSLIVLKDTHGLKDVLSILNQFDVILYQSETDANYFLLQMK